MPDTLPLVAVVDDDESIRVSTSSLLRSHGYSVRTFSAADEFLCSDEASLFACVISDIQMPGTDGLGLAQAYRTAGGAAPIIFITAFYDAKIAARARAAGVADILNKPFDPQALVEAIVRALKNP